MLCGTSTGSSWKPDGATSTLPSTTVKLTLSKDLSTLKYKVANVSLFVSLTVDAFTPTLHVPSVWVTVKSFTQLTNDAVWSYVQLPAKVSVYDHS